MENINFFIVFIEGILSISSPCILPILPVYLSMLSNSSIDTIKDSKFKNSLLLKNTIFFTLGISVTFFMLGSSMNILSSFLNTNRYMINIIGGFAIIFMGLFYVGIIQSTMLNREKRFKTKNKEMTPISSFILGFTFSFGWTPCIGPILASVLIMASSSDNTITSNLLILVYTIGFILPFIIAALFYNKLFKKFDKVKEYMGLIKKISGMFIIIAGLVMIINGFVGMNRTLAIKNNNSSQKNTAISDEEKKSEENNIDENKKEEPEKLEPIDFNLYDQYGNEHILSEYKGKIIFLNFWATWCPPCKEEMPYIEELYKEYNENQDDVVILGVAAPNLGREGTEEYITEFLEEEGYTFPVVFDKKAEMVFGYGINAFPSTFIIDKEGYIKKYVPGAMNKKTMKQLIESER